MASEEALRLAPSRLDDSDVEVDENLLSSSDNESEDEESKHSNIKKVIDTLDKVSTKRRKHQRFEPSLNVSEYNLSTSAENDKVELNDLIGSLKKDGGYGNLKKKLESMEKNAGTLDVPLNKPEAEKIQRTIAFDETSKEVGKWQPIVKKNREAEHLSFPLNHQQISAVSTKTLTANFKPRTPLEEEIAAVLKGSSHMMERTNKELTEEEEQALLTMSVEEAKERRKELQRLRALQSYYEEKCRRAKKIKSKKYHRIKKKGEKRTAEKHLEDLEKTDPEKALEELEKLDRERAKERLSLKHRSTSKWAKNLLIRGQNNPEAKKALQEQLDLSRKLTEKQREMSESEEEEESGVLKEDDDESNTFGRLVAEADNPWSIDKTGDATALDGNEKKTNELSGFKLAEPIINKESVYIDNNNENSDLEAPEDDFEITLSKNTKPTKSTKKKRKQKTSDEVHESKISKTNEKAKKDKIKKKIKKKKHEGNDEENDETEFHEIESNNQDLVNNSTPNKTATAKSAKPKKSAKPTSFILDPKKIFPHEDGNLQSDDADQLMTIQQAFANDDVIEEFVREKEDAVELSKGKDLDLTLPGWGEWGGPGVKVSVKKKNKFVKKAEEKSSRKDKDLAHVIINEEVNKKFAKIQVKNVPHPYMNPNQFEKSIRNPVGKHWNTASSVKQLTQPRVETLMGTIIEPIKPTKQFKRSKNDDNSNNKNKKKRKSNIDGGESLVIYN